MNNETATTEYDPQASFEERMAALQEQQSSMMKREANRRKWGQWDKNKAKRKGGAK